ncbi:MAG: Arm DNA-binding domain-containing protein, partial [Desulfovibrio sp.]|nr:Arm DNA-binding domain-containing protein [Desulfovibrio sp.]
MKLTDTFLRALKATGKVQKYSDGGGLYIYVSPAGGTLWRMGYRFEGKQKLLSFGGYPAVSLKEARKRRGAAKEQLAQGIDPAAHKQAVKAAAAIQAKEQAVTFEAVAREWFSKKTAVFTPGHQKKILSRLENQLFPYIGNIPFSSLDPQTILAAVRHAENRGVIETSHRLAQLAGQVTR